MRSLIDTYLLGLFFTAFVSSVCHAYDMVPGPEQKTPILLTNGTIHTVTGENITNGQILFEDGVILAIGKTVKVPANCETIDVSGKHVYPGLIAGISSIGLVEINSVRATIDFGELGTINSNIRAEVAVNPDSEIIPVTRANGILMAHVITSTSRGGLVAGTSAVMKLDGWTTENMTLQAPVGMTISWPGDPNIARFNPETAGANNPDKAEENYAKTIKKLGDLFKDARAFWNAKDNGKATLDVDLRWEALGPVLSKEIPVHIFAQTARQIRDAVQWAKAEKVNMVLLGGADAWRLTDLLKDNKVAVIIGGVNLLPLRRSDSYDSLYANATRLHRAGVQFAIGYSGSEAKQRNLPYEAGKAVAFGLPKDEALKAITIYPAKILGIADRVGSLEVGKDATLIVTTGDPLDIRSNVEMAFIQGRPVDLSSRHTQLYEKYQQRYQQN